MKLPLPQIEIQVTKVDQRSTLVAWEFEGKIRLNAYMSPDIYVLTPEATKILIAKLQELLEGISNARSQGNQHL